MYMYSSGTTYKTILGNYVIVISKYLINLHSSFINMCKYCEVGSLRITDSVYSI